MKKIPALLGVGLCISAALASDTKEEETPFLRETDNIAANLDDYREAPDGTPRYFLVRGIMCRAIWENGKLLVCKAGDTGLETEDGKPYFSPLLWALLDYRQCTRQTPGKLENPRIQGNTPQQARELVIRLIVENKNKCVNDSMGEHVTPLLLAEDDEKIVHLLTIRWADPNKAIYPDGTTLLYRAAEQGWAEVVFSLLSGGANPTFEFNPHLENILSKRHIEEQKDLNKLKCQALIAEAQTRWKKK